MTSVNLGRSCDKFMLDKSYISFKNRILVSYLRALLKSVAPNSKERDGIIRDTALALTHIDSEKTYKEIETDLINFLNENSGVKQIKSLSMFYKNSSDYLDKIESMPDLKENGMLLDCLKNIRQVVESHKISITDKIRYKAHHNTKSIKGYYRKIREKSRRQ